MLAHSLMAVLAMLGNTALISAAPAATITETVTKIETYTLLIETILIEPTTITVEASGCGQTTKDSTGPPTIVVPSNVAPTAASTYSSGSKAFSSSSPSPYPSFSASSAPASTSLVIVPTSAPAPSSSGSYSATKSASSSSEASQGSVSASSSVSSSCPAASATSRADTFKLNSTLPGLPFEIPESYAGYLSVNASEPTDPRELYFWYTAVDKSVGSDDDIIFWFNGGPGCSSMEGLFQENGPFQLPYYPQGGSVAPVLNPWSNHRAAHAVWVDSPGNTGFSQAGLHVQGLTGVAEDIAGFMVNFFAAFPELQGKRLWLQGESYAGAMIPYMADRIYSDDSLKCKGINLKGVQINDPSWANDIYMEQLAIYPFAVKNKDVLGFNDSLLADFQAKAAPYGLDTYYSTHITYPPTGPLPYPTNWTGPDTYDIYDDVLSAWNGAHCSSVYDISTQCPYTVDPLGYPQAAVDPSLDNFPNNQTGFLAAIHVKPNVTFLECRADVYDDLNQTPPNE